MEYAKAFIEKEIERHKILIETEKGFKDEYLDRLKK